MERRLKTDSVHQVLFNLLQGPSLRFGQLEEDEGETEDTNDRVEPECAPDGQPSFQVLQNRGKLPTGYQLVLYVFDLLFLNGKSLLKQPLSERRSRLPQLLSDTRVLFSSPLNGTPAVLMKAVRKHNLEGNR
jgi:hypothetical protein